MDLFKVGAVYNDLEYLLIIVTMQTIHHKIDN